MDFVAGIVGIPAGHRIQHCGDMLFTGFLVFEDYAADGSHVSKFCSSAVACGERSRTMQLMNIIFCEDNEEGPQIGTNKNTNDHKYLSPFVLPFVCICGHLPYLCRHEL